MAQAQRRLGAQSPLRAAAAALAVLTLAAAAVGRAGAVVEWSAPFDGGSGSNGWYLRTEGSGAATTTWASTAAGRLGGTGLALGVTALSGSLSGVAMSVSRAVLDARGQRRRPRLPAGACRAAAAASLCGTI